MSASVVLKPAGVLQLLVQGALNHDSQRAIIVLDGTSVMLDILAESNS